MVTDHRAAEDPDPAFAFFTLYQQDRLHQKRKKILHTGVWVCTHKDWFFASYFIMVLFQLAFGVFTLCQNERENEVGLRRI